MKNEGMCKSEQIKLNSGNSSCLLSLIVAGKVKRKWVDTYLIYDALVSLFSVINMFLPQWCHCGSHGIFQDLTINWFTHQLVIHIATLLPQFVTRDL